jgi:prolyl-tRNA editing enzyme YbaK/EbsC (Cys-tRNA(Pro) deacylase)
VYPVLDLQRRLCLALCVAALGVRAQDIRLAAESELVSLCGFVRGGIGPVGWKAQRYTVLLDEALWPSRGPDLVADDDVHGSGGGPVRLCGAGAPGWLVPLQARDLVDKLNARVVPLSQDQ